MDNSPFLHHLYTNHTPSDDEADKIKMFLAVPLAHLSNLEEEIRRTQLVLDNLLQERDSLNKGIEAHRALISPMRRLPPDVLQEIFVQCLPSGRNPVMSAADAPLLICRICSGWRKLALSIPLLWNSIHIYIPPYKELPFVDAESSPPAEIATRICILRANGMQEWLDRSGSLPLRISVYFDGITSNQIHPILSEKLLLFSRRWHELSFHGEIPDFPQLSEEDTPLLRSLHVDGAWGYQWPPAFLHSARQLHCVSLTSYSKEYPLSWSQLTELNILNGMDPSKTLSITDVLYILQNSPGLIKCTLTINVRNGITDSSGFQSQIALPYLKFLGIHSIRDDLRELFSNLHVPALCEMEYQVYNVSYANLPPTTTYRPIMSLLMLLAHCGDSLMSLSLNPGGWSLGDIQECLEKTPFLTRLAFISDHSRTAALRFPMSIYAPSPSTPSPLTDELLNWLTPLPENSIGCQLPKLEEFHCKFYSTFSDKSLSTFIRARRSGYKGITRLQRVHVMLGQYRDDNRTYLPPPYAEEGLEGEILYARRPARTIFSPWKGTTFSAQELSDFASPGNFLVGFG